MFCMYITSAMQHILVGVGDSNITPSGLLASLGGIAPAFLMMAVVYVLILRPSAKQRKEQQSMLQALKKDDEVLTSAGFYGRIVSLDDKVATLEIADKVKIRVLRDRIAGKWSDSQTTKST